MRIVWKDSSARGHKPVKYRGFYAEGYNRGWTINVPGDDNIYKTHYCALNAIDQMLGGKTRKANPKRHQLGITVVGRKDDVS